MAKHNQRLDYARLAEVLHERGMADLESLRELLQQSLAGGVPFAEALVNSGLVSDWELSRVVCEIFNLAFVPVDMLEARPDVARGIPRDFLVENGLVPIGKFGQVMTVAMPGLVPADVLALLAAESEYVILPVVGTVETNRRWLTEHLSEELETAPEPEAPEIEEDEVKEALEAIQVEEIPAPTPAGQPAEGGDGWGNMFDDADAAVLDDIVATVDIDTDALEFTDVDDADSLIDLADDALDEISSGSSGGGAIDLPPMPDFE